MMFKFVLAAACSFCLLDNVYANTIPYPNPGHENPDVYTFTAATTGDLSAYFYGSTAAFEESLGLVINGKNSGITGLDNKMTANGIQLDFGNVNKGDLLTFYINVSDFFQGKDFTYFSNPALNSDATNHVYATPFSGDPVIKATGTYVGFEDLSPKNDGSSDFNYQDEEFVFTNTSTTIASGVPEPSTWAMMLFGFVGLSFLRYRKSRKTNTDSMLAA